MPAASISAEGSGLVRRPPATVWRLTLDTSTVARQEAGLRKAPNVDSSRLSPELVERRVYHMIDVARGYAQQRNDAAAVLTLLEAERVAPEEVRFHVIVPELLRELLKRERRAATPGLRPLAARVGVLS